MPKKSDSENPCGLPDPDALQFGLSDVEASIYLELRRSLNPAIVKPENVLEVWALTRLINKIEINDKYEDRGGVGNSNPYRTFA